MSGMHKGGISNSSSHREIQGAIFSRKFCVPPTCIRCIFSFGRNPSARTNVINDHQKCSRTGLVNFCLPIIARDTIDKRENGPDCISEGRSCQTPAFPRTSKLFSSFQHEITKKAATEKRAGLGTPHNFPLTCFFSVGLFPKT